MRKMLLSLIAVGLVFVMTSCIVIPLYHRFEIEESEVSSIEVYDICNYYESDLYRELSYYEYFEKKEISYQISAEEKGVFLKDLAEIQFSDHIVIVIAAIDPSFNYDTWTVRINYTDGSSQFISSAGYGETYDANGNFISGTGHHWGCEEEDWLGLIEKYVPAGALSHDH